MNTNDLSFLKFGRESLFVSSQQLFLHNTFALRKNLIVHKFFENDEEFWMIPHFPFENYLYLIGPNALSLVKDEPERSLDCLSLIYLLSRHETLSKKDKNPESRQKNQNISKRLKNWAKSKLETHPLREEFTWLNKQVGKHFPPQIVSFKFIPNLYVLHTDKEPPPVIWEKCADLMMAMLIEKNNFESS